MNYWLVPATKINLNVSIRKPVSFAFVSKHLGQQQAEEIQQATGTGRALHCWAFRETENSTKKARLMKVDDLVLIREKGAVAFEFLGHVCHKVDSEAFGNDLWPERSKDPWVHIYFLKNLQKVDINFARFKREAGFKENDRLQGARRLTENPLYRLQSRYDSFEKFLESFGTEPGPGPTPPPLPGSGPLPKEILRALMRLNEDVARLKKDPKHTERAHESLVEQFFEILGYRRIEEIKHRQGRVDIQITSGTKTIMVIEVKRHWNLDRHDLNALQQAYRYAQETGSPIVVITNGDYYAVYDRTQGLSYEENYKGEFRISEFNNLDPAIINFLKKKSD